MSTQRDFRKFCNAIADYDSRLTVYTLEGKECIVGPLNAVTPLCFPSTRKSGDEYRVDFDLALISMKGSDYSFEHLAGHINAGDWLWKHNVFPTSFFWHTFTKNKLPQSELTARIGDFLLIHSRAASDARRFVESEDTKFLNDCRRLKPKDFEKFVAKVATVI